MRTFIIIFITVFIVMSCSSKKPRDSNKHHKKGHNFYKEHNTKHSQKKRRKALQYPKSQ